NIEIHLFQTPFNANKNKRKIYDQEKIINSVQVLPVTLEHILDFDCIADFSSMTLRDTFDTLPMIDFFLENLGIEPNTIDKKEKRNFLKVNEKIANEEKIKFLALRESKRPLLMLHTLASVHIRSMPEIVIEKLVVKLI